MKAVTLEQYQTLVKKGQLYIVIEKHTELFADSMFFIKDKVILESKENRMMSMLDADLLKYVDHQNEK